MERRKFKAVRNHPGIFAGTRPGQTHADRWVVSFRVRGLGQRTKTFLSLSEAKQFRAELHTRDKHEELRRRERGKVPLGEFLLSYCGRRKDWAESTRERYRFAADLILAGRLARIPVSRIVREDVQGWLDDMVAAGVPHGSYEKAFRLAHLVLGEAANDKMAMENPADRVRLPKRIKPEQLCLTLQQVANIAEEVPHRHRAAVYLLGLRGLRIGELSALQVRDVDLDAMTVRIERSSPEVGGRKFISGTKTEAGRRTVPLSPVLAEMLAGHLAEFGPRTADGDPDPLGFVFSHGQGGQIRQNNWRARVFQPACERLGITRPSIEGKSRLPRVHDLRHSAASMLLSEGFAPHEVQAILGHSSSQTTLRIYAHVIPEAVRAKAAVLDGTVQEAMAKARGGSVIDLASRTAVGV